VEGGVEITMKITQRRSTSENSFSRI
jgi:hypothetical protein